VLPALEGFLDLFRQHGAWAFVVLAGIVIWRMAVYIQTMQAKHQDTIKELLLDRNKEQKEETKQLVSAMMSTERALQAINGTLNALAARMD